MLNNILKITIHEHHKMKCEIAVSSDKLVPADLEISGDFRSITITGEINQLNFGDEIKGIADNGYMFITSAIKSRSFSTSIPGISVEQYYFDHICFMKPRNWTEINKLQDFKLEEANISLSGLTNWMPHSIYKDNWPAIEGKFQEVKRIPDKEALLANVTHDNVNFNLFKHEELRFIPQYNGLDIRISEQIGLKFEDQIGLSKLSTISNDVSNFFSLIWDLPTNIMNINQIDMGKKEFNLLLGQEKTYDDQQNKPQIFEFKSYECITIAIQNYFNLLKTPLKSLITEYLSVSKLNLDVNIKLIQLCQGIEASIQDDLDLQHKIMEVLKSFAEGFNITNERVEGFARKIKNNRVNITHGENRQIIFNDNELLVAVATLGVACHFYLFQNLGIDDVYKSEFRKEIKNIKLSTGLDPITLFTVVNEN